MDAMHRACARPQQKQLTHRTKGFRDVNHPNKALRIAGSLRSQVKRLKGLNMLRCAPALVFARLLLALVGLRFGASAHAVLPT